MISRILAALADSMEIPAAAGESVLGTIKIAVMPIAKVFTMCFLGLLMASKYVNILPPSGRKLLNGVGAIILYTYVYQMFAPPPEGFDAEEENLPLKNLPVDAAPEQVPLLTQNFPKDISPAQVRLPVQNTGPRGRTDSRKSKITQIFVFLYEKLKLKQIVLFMYYLSIR
ncbi:hypothetical protein CARUB_v10012723mg [Capsella rubella]|uniref:Uncharacterized protein n=1 Tax=Capsella rubella TaxID=81985 RepID=R0ETW3_9BRAS|nr:hypothetical protein CARUB_v10012723mg [Capsella rubella]